MRIIFSPKGFDSQYGGVPSPILEGALIASLPIPSKYGRALTGLWRDTVPMESLVSDLSGGRYGPNDAFGSLPRKSQHDLPGRRSPSHGRAVAGAPGSGRVRALVARLAAHLAGLPPIDLALAALDGTERSEGNRAVVPPEPR